MSPLIKTNKANEFLLASKMEICPDFDIIFIDDNPNNY